MGTVRFVAGLDVRKRWRRIVALALLVGVVAGVALAAAAGARRSGTSLDRFRSTSRAADVELAVVGRPAEAQLRALRERGDVAAVSQLRAFGLLVPGAPDLEAIGAPLDSASGRTVDRPRLVSGRLVDRTVPDEVAIGETLARQLHVGVGDRVPVNSYAPAQVDAIVAGAADAGAPAGPRIRLRVVGIVRRPLDLGDRATSGGFLVLSPAFPRAYAGRVGVFGTYLRIRTRTGLDGVPHTIRAARQILGASLLSTQNLTVEVDGPRDAIGVVTLALWIVAGVVALAGLVAIGIVLAREIALATVNDRALRALGVTRPWRAAIVAAPAVLVALGGAVLGIVLAVAMSPLLPTGVARHADPDVGLHADSTVLSAGAAATLVALLAIASASAWRATGRSEQVEAPAPSRVSLAITRGAARIGLAPSIANGVRMATDRGRGRSIVPIRSAFAGAVIGVLGVTAVLVFASSLEHVSTTPRLYGWTWDFLSDDATPNTACGGDTYGIGGVRGVAAVAEICHENVELDHRPTSGIALTSITGSRIDPTIVAGRAPAARHEVAVGAATLDALSKGIGDTVRAKGVHGSVTYRIVGEVAFPTLGQVQPLADGAWFTGAGFGPLYNNGLFSRYFVGRFAGGAVTAEVTRRLSSIPQLGAPVGPTRPVEIDRVRQVNWFPTTIALLVGGLGLLAVGHALVTAVRRRRGELAVLKTIGFDRRQVRLTAASQASTLAVVGLAVGIPAGLVVGNAVWRAVAGGLGVPPVTTVPVAAFAVMVPLALLVVNVVAFFPGRAAARTRPALALRSE